MLTSPLLWRPTELAPIRDRSTDPEGNPPRVVRVRHQNGGGYARRSLTCLSQEWACPKSGPVPRAALIDIHDIHGYPWMHCEYVIYDFVASGSK
jgi:hypothetical protein